MAPTTIQEEIEPIEDHVKVSPSYIEDLEDEQEEDSILDLGSALSQGIKYLRTM